MPEARIDKWMWAARIFKTRTIAAEACKKGRISINGSQVKPARMVKPGDVVQVRKPPVTYSFKVLQAIEKRVGAKLVPEIMENVTTPDQYFPAHTHWGYKNSWYTDNHLHSLQQSSILYTILLYPP